MLDETRRVQLDNIVKQAIANKEKDSTIQLIVKDFIGKYDTGPIVKQEEKPIGGLAGLGVGALKGLGSTAVGLGQVVLKGASLIPGLKGIAKTGIQEGEELKQGALKAKGTTQTIGKVGEQIAEMFIPVGTVGKIASKIPKLAKGAIEFGGKTFLQTGGDTKQALEAGVLAGTIPVAGKVIKGIGKGVAEKVIPLSAREAGLVQTYKANVPFSKRLLSLLSGEEFKNAPRIAGKTAFERGVKGTESMIGVQAKKANEKLWNNFIAPSLKESKKGVSMSSFFDEAEKTIIKKNPEISRQKSLLEALNAFKEDYSKVKNVSMEQLQKFKEGWAEFVPEKTYRGKPIAGAFNDVKNTLASIARNKIYNIFPTEELKLAYFDYGNLKGLQELGKKAMTGGKLKGGFGSFWSAIKDMSLVPVGTIGGKVVYRVGQGIEIVGKQGAKTISDILNF